MSPVLLAWFGMAVLVEVGSSVGLCFWLRSRGLRVSSIWYGFPGYLESLYVRWRNSHAQSARTLVVLRVLSKANLIAAGAVFIARAVR